MLVMLLLLKICAVVGLQELNVDENKMLELKKFERAYRQQEAQYEGFNENCDLGRYFNKASLEEHGWALSGFTGHDLYKNSFRPRCPNYAWMGRGQDEAAVSKTMTGSGFGILQFSNCGKDGSYTSVYLDGVEIASLQHYFNNALVFFEFTDGQVLELKGGNGNNVLSMTMLATCILPNPVGPTYEKHGKSQCFTRNTRYPGDQADNPIFWSMVGTAVACKSKCDDPNTMDSRGRRCVAFEHSSQDPYAVANCAFAWDCSETRFWGGGIVYRRTEVSRPTYEEHGKSQCFTRNTRYPGDRADNPIFWSMVGTAVACKSKCDDPNTMDSRGRRCVAFEHSSQDPYAVANCAFAWDCSEIRFWGGGKVYRRTEVSKL